MKRILFETDWLASQPVFYNEKTSQASHNINDVIDYTDLELHPEGFNNYLDFGYSVLEQTPVRHVKFLRYSSRLWVDNKGALSVEYLGDPVEQWLDYRLSEENIIDLIRERVQAWEHSVEGEIVIPTSGGYDSRLLDWCIEDKSRVRSFTYGISENQAESFEVVYARQLSEFLGTRWEQITLGDYHQYFDDWDNLFGVSTHAHGMYHFEFYQKLLPKVQGGNPFLSGIFGDVWAGSTQPPVLNSYLELNKLGYTHGMNADIKTSVYSPSYELRNLFLAQNSEQLINERYRVIIQIRLKIMLISYLLRVPRFFGFKPWSPFLDIDVCMSMLNLPSERKRDRVWQKEFFRKIRLDLEAMNLPISRQNNLNHQAMLRVPIKPLDTLLLAEVIKPTYIKWINRETVPQMTLNDLINTLMTIPKLGGVLRKAGFHPNRLPAYCAYLTLLPIQKMLEKRNKRSDDS
jgi:hypothetical protein